MCDYRHQQYVHTWLLVLTAEHWLNAIILSLAVLGFFLALDYSQTVLLFGKRELQL